MGIEFHRGSAVRRSMRGDQEQQNEMYSYRSSDMRVPADHRLRVMRQMCDEALRQLSSTFDELYSTRGGD